MLSAGSPAPDIQLTGLGGASLTLSSVTAQAPAVVAFFKAGCPTCQLAFPYLERLAKGGLRFIAVSQDNAQITAAFQEKFGITFETTLDPATGGYAASNAFGLTNVPSIFVIEPGGRISTAFKGFDKAEFEALGQRAGVEPFTPQDNVPAFKPG